MSSIGDSVGTLAAVNPGGTLVIRPSGSLEVTIHNFYYSGSVDIYYVCAGNQVKLAWDVEEGSLQGFWHASQAHYFLMVNPTQSTLYYGYDGIVTKV